MARISGIDLPKNKRIEVGLTYVYGIGLTTSQKILTALAIDFNTRVKDLSEDEIVKLRDAVNEHPNEGDLRRKINQDIRRLGEINSFIGSRHLKKLPCI